jgi:hypothetical protein
MKYFNSLWFTVYGKVQNIYIYALRFFLMNFSLLVWNEVHNCFVCAQFVAVKSIPCYKNLCYEPGCTNFCAVEFLCFILYASILQITGNSKVPTLSANLNKFFNFFHGSFRDVNLDLTITGLSKTFLIYLPSYHLMLTPTVLYITLTHSPPKNS